MHPIRNGTNLESVAYTIKQQTYMLEYKRLKQARLKQEAIRKARQRVLIDLPRTKFEQELKSNPTKLRASNNWPNRNSINTIGIRVTTKSKYTPVHAEK